MQMIRKLLILLLSPLPKGTFVHVSRHNFFVISRSSSTGKISFIHVTRPQKRQIHVYVKNFIHVHDVEKRLIHVHDMKKRPIHVPSSTFTTWKRASSRFKSCLVRWGVN